MKAGTGEGRSIGSAGSSKPGRILDAGRARRLPRVFPGLRVADRYVARIFLGAYLACGISFTGIYIMVEALLKLDKFLKVKKPLWIALPEYHAAMVPTIFVNYLGPIITTAAAVVTATFLHRGNELVPLKACGVSAHRTFLPVFLLAVGFAGLNYYLQEEAIPRLRGPIRQAISFTHEGVLKPAPFSDSAGNLIKITQYSPALQFGRGVEILRRYPDGRVKEKVDASEIVWEADPDAPPGQDRGRWFLHNGSIQRWSQEGDLIQNPGASDFDRLKEPFQKMELLSDLLPIDLETSDQDIAYLSFLELKKQFRRQPYQKHLAVKLHHHLAFPLTHLLLPALAIPIVLGLGTRSLLLAVAMSILVCAAFYLTSSLALSTAVHSDHFKPILAAWLPMLLFGALGVTLMANLKT